jgi:hypothetical protein
MGIINSHVPNHCIAISTRQNVARIHEDCKFPCSKPLHCHLYQSKVLWPSSFMMHNLWLTMFLGLALWRDAKWLFLVISNTYILCLDGHDKCISCLYMDDIYFSKTKSYIYSSQQWINVTFISSHFHILKCVSKFYNSNFM